LESGRIAAATPAKKYSDVHRGDDSDPVLVPLRIDERDHSAAARDNHYRRSPLHRLEVWQKGSMPVIACKLLRLIRYASIALLIPGLLLVMSGSLFMPGSF